MADFVKDAFREAIDASSEAEYQAYKSTISDNIGEILMHAGAKVGLDRVNDLSGTIIHAGQEDILCDFTQALLMAAFHLGYQKGREVL